MTEQQNTSKTTPAKHSRWDNFFIKRRQRWFRKTANEIHELYPDLDRSTVFTDFQEHEGLSQDPQEKLVQKHFYSFLGLLVADRLTRANRFLVVRTVFFTAVIAFVLGLIALLTGTFAPQRALIAVFAIYVGLHIIGFSTKLPFHRWFLPRQDKVIFKEDVEATKDVISRTLVREFDKNTTPEDLHDRYRNGVTDRDGAPTAGQILMEDLTVPYLVKSYAQAYRLHLELALFTSIWIITSMATLQHIGNVFGGFGGNGSNFLGMITSNAALIIDGAFAILSNLIWAVLGFEFYYHVLSPTSLNGRAKLAQHAMAQSSTMDMVDRVGGPDYFKNIEKSREAQIENASKDKSKFFDLGVNTGLMFERRDYFGANKGTKFGLSLDDLSKHMLLLGATGSGKTSTIIKMLAKSILTAPNEDFGRKNGAAVLILDGKGPLGEEMKDVAGDDYVVISPENCNYNPIEGLNSEEVTQCLYELFSSADSASSNDDFWGQSAATLIRSSGVLLELSNQPWTMQNLHKAVTNTNWLSENILDDIPDYNDMLPYQQAALDYRIEEFVQMADKQKSGILSTAGLWISSVLNNRLFDTWSTCEHGDVRIEDCIYGAKMSVNLPEAKYQFAGQIISSLAKKRLFKAIKQRGNDWKNDPEQTQVVYICDEAQLLIDSDDEAIASIARSLGLSMVLSTQSVDAIVQRLGDKTKAWALLGNLVNLVALQVTTELSKEYIAQKLGSGWRSQVTTSHSIPDMRSEFNAWQENPSDKLVANTHLIHDTVPTGGVVRGTMNKIREVWQAVDTGSDVTIGCTNFVSEAEIESLLSLPNSALYSISRGRVPRRDLVNLTPIYAVEEAK